MEVSKTRRWRTGRRGSWSLLVLAGLLLAACSGPSTLPPPTSPIPGPTATLPLPSATPTAVAPEPLVETLTLWMPEEIDPYGEGAGALLLAQQLDSFNQAYDDLQVEVIVKSAHGRGGLLDFLRTANAATVETVLPDLMVLNVDELEVAAQEGLLQPFGGLLPEELVIDRFPFAVPLGQVDGETFGIPMTADLEQLAYQPALLDSPPLTWTDVVSSETSFVFPAAGQEGKVNDATLVQYLAAGGRLTDDEGNPQLEAAPLTAVLDFYVQAAAAGVISPTVILSLSSAAECWDLLQNGQAGMAIVESSRLWAEPTSVAAGVIPTRDGGVMALAQGEWVLVMVASDPQRQQQAMLLVEWLMDGERYGAWTQSAGYLPTTRGGLAAWVISEEDRVMLEVLLEGAQLSPPPSVWEAVGSPLQVALDAVLRGRRSPADAAANAARGVRP